MGSVRCPPPVPHPTNLPVLEAKVDHLTHKLDELLSREIGACTICSTCSLHSGQPEATERQLVAQSRLLENLERKISEMQRTLEGLAKGLEQRNPHTCQGASPAPPIEPPPRTVYLPARTSLVTSKDEIPDQLETNRQQDKTQHTPTTPAKKEIDATKTLTRLAVAVVPSTVHTQKTLTQTRTTVTKNQAATPIEASLRTASLPVSDSLSTEKAETQNQFETNRHQETTQHTPIAPAKKGMGAEQRDCVGAAAGEQRIGGNQQGVRGQPMAAESHRQSETKRGGMREVPAVAIVPSMADTPKTQTRTTVTENQAAAPSSPTPAPKNQSGLAVLMATVESSSLRQVHSCPESLQRIQSSRPMPQSVCPARGPAVGKTCSVLGRASPVAASGIQIRVVPAAAERTRPKSPPKTCHKVIDDVPPQPAPFLHHCVSLRSNPTSDTFIIHTREVLGSGRFGKVHKCTEKSSGLKLAAKIINTRTAKEKERANNEVQVMNQLSHPNILQLYEAFEAKHQLVLILEYVEGGELFDRIVDESTPLTEVDAMVFVKQICEGVSYMHQMYVLHLDLKPENILCVNRTGHQVKIIDFGLARRYRPREKLRVNFGTPEFLAPEVVNFDFVSFPTDMWTLGVVTYMLLSGLSPFLGDDDSQTLNNVLSANGSFEDEAFEHISAEAKDFISHLLVKERGGRMSAAQCLRHPWLNNIAEKAKGSNIVLKSQVLLKKYLAKRLWKKNYIAIAAANRFKKISSGGELTSLDTDMDTVPIATVMEQTARALS
ncbi:hypothetical protein J4Q44_G00260440 [Coregonus suidteri]|uniref:Protein kinase domain-containing protein n=1 Tax=Coregonus suidteri TaxID=861788 RepID=A0AAN8QGB1_9TELE